MNKSSIITISEPTLKRLPKYLNVLERLKEAGNKYASCTDIANTVGFLPIQVRKDLQQTGAVGKPKVGYTIESTIENIENTLGYNNKSEAVLVGAGNLGNALLGFPGFDRCGMKIIAAFDTDDNKIGKNLYGVTVFHIDKLINLVERLHIKVGIIALPYKDAQKTADLLVSAGVKGIWNFSPATLKVPDDVAVQNEDLSVSLSVLLSKIK